MRPSQADRRRHVGHANCAVIGDQLARTQCAIAQMERPVSDIDILPFAVADADRRRSRKEVRIGNLKRTVRSIEFDRQTTMLPDIPRCVEHDACAAFQRQQGADRCRRLDRDLFAGTRTAADGANRIAHTRGRADSCDRTGEIDELCHVVGPEIEDRTAAGLKKKSGLGCQASMPAKGTLAPADDPADAAVIDCLPACLMARTEEGIRRTADPQPFSRAKASSALA